MDTSNGYMNYVSPHANVAPQVLKGTRRARARNVPGVAEEQQGGRCTWSRASGGEWAEERPGDDGGRMRQA